MSRDTQKRILEIILNESLTIGELHALEDYICKIRWSLERKEKEHLQELATTLAIGVVE